MSLLIKKGATLSMNDGNGGVVKKTVEHINTFPAMITLDDGSKMPLFSLVMFINNNELNCLKVGTKKVTGVAGEEFTFECSNTNRVLKYVRDENLRLVEVVEAQVAVTEDEQLALAELDDSQQEDSAEEKTAKKPTKKK